MKTSENIREYSAKINTDRRNTADLILEYIRYAYAKASEGEQYAYYAGKVSSTSYSSRDTDLVKNFNGSLL